MNIPSFCNWIDVPTEELRNHLSEIGIPAKTHTNMESLYFTNAVYMLLLDVFLCENNMENGDVIKFYKQVGPLKS